MAIGTITRNSFSNDRHVCYNPPARDVKTLLLYKLAQHIFREDVSERAAYKFKLSRALAGMTLGFVTGMALTMPIWEIGNGIITNGTKKEELLLGWSLITVSLGLSSFCCLVGILVSCKKDRQPLINET